MRNAVNLLALGGAAFAIAAAAPAVGESGWAAVGESGWVPSFAVTGGATIQKWDSSVDSFCENGGRGSEDLERPLIFNELFAACIGQPRNPLFPIENPPPEHTPETWALRRAASGTDRDVSPFLGFDLQLMTPTIPWVPGRPRAFARGEFQLTFGSTRNIASEGEPSGVRFPTSVRDPVTGIQPPENVPTEAISGVGSRTASETQMLGWGAGAGIAFPLRVRGRQLWLKPGAAWTRYTVDVKGIVVAGLKNDPRTPEPKPFQMGSELREIHLSGASSKTFDGIGPSLEIEMDVGHFGPIGISLFVGAGAYWIAGDRSIEFSDSAFFGLGEYVPGVLGPFDGYGTNPGAPTTGCFLRRVTCNRLPEDTYTANWSFEVDPWLYRARLGLRFSWLGK